MVLIAFISQCHGRALQAVLKQPDDLIACGLYSVIEGLGTYEQTVKGARELQAKRCRREKEARAGGQEQEAPSSVCVCVGGKASHLQCLCCLPLGCVALGH